jgi:glycosyltransferase involved in cell wall biosynthesis
MAFTVNFLIVASGLNCEKFVNKCFKSIQAQTHPNFKACLIDDGSTDLTSYRLGMLSGVDKRIAVYSWRKNTGAAYRRFMAIHQEAIDPETVVVLLGLDDELLPNALEVIAKQYEAGKWMTYGNWVNQHRKKCTVELDFPEEIHQAREYRKVKYRSTAPNTFKKFLFDRIPPSDFQLNDKWIDTTTESELMFSCLEMCGKDRIGIIREKIYLYNERLPGGTLVRLGSEYKYKVYNQIIQRPKKELLIRSNNL